jgi:hypothetical protein
MRISLLVALLALAFAYTPAISGENEAANDTAATDSGKVSVNDVFGRYGFSSAPHVTSSVCNVEMGLNQQKFLDNIGELQKLGVLNPDLTQTTINLKPNSLSLAFALQSIPVATKEVYDNNKDADRCEFSQSMVIVDEYGNNKKLLMFSYHFTRAIYQKINWDNFLSQNMLKVAPKFHFSSEFQSVVVKERLAGD